MKETEITMMRIYITEGEGKLQELLDFLKEDQEVRGLTVFRGISGFGTTAHLHDAGLLDLSLDMPLVIELFDEPDKMQKIFQTLSSKVKSGHLVSWAAKMNINGK